MAIIFTISTVSLVIRIILILTYPTARVQLQPPGNQPEGMSGVGGEWCSLWLGVRDYTCLFQTSGLLLYFFKRMRSEVFHFQLPLTQIYYLLVALQTEFLLQRFSQNGVYLWLHCNSCLCLGCMPHASVYFLSFYILLSPSIRSWLSPKKASSYS